MTIGDHISEFQGLPVHTVEAGAAFPSVDRPVAWRYEVGGDGEGVEREGLLAAWLDALPDPASVQALILGPTGENYEEPLPIDVLIAAKAKLPSLRAIFLGEMTFEECEISWIIQEDVSRLLDAFDGQLEAFYVRGGTNLAIQPATRSNLRELVIETGGLDRSVVSAIGASQLPALTRLDLWLGTEEYGATTTDDDLAPLLTGDATPALTYLGLVNSDRPLENITLLAASALLPKLQTLSLSMGTTGDECIDVLTGGAFAHLAELDLHHHYFTDEGMARIRAAFPNTVVNLEDQEDAGEDDEDRFVAVGE